MNKRQQQAEQSRKKIYDAAERLFARHGYRSVTIEEICREAGVSKGLFYNYFPSKFAIALEFSQSLEDIYRQQMESFGPDLTAPEKLRQMFLCILEATLFNPTIQKNARVNYEREVRGGQTLIFQPGRPLFTYLHQIAREGQESGQFSAKIPPSTIVDITFRYAVGSLIYLFNVSPVEKQREAIQQAARDFDCICRSFLPGPEA